MSTRPAGIRNIPAIGLALFLMGGVAALAAVWAPADTRFLVESYTSFIVLEQVQAQGHSFGAGLDEKAKKEVDDAVESWGGRGRERIRMSLQKAMGDQSRPKFEAFVADFSTAESRNDTNFLAATADAIGWRPDQPGTYEGLRLYVAEHALAEEVRSGADLLGEIQTWVDLRAKGNAVPPLDDWLNRTRAAGQLPRPVEPVKTANPLKSGEAAPPSLGEMPGGETRNPLDDFAQLRDERRQKALEQAQAGMQQVAAERDAAEQEYAAKKTASAMAEADARQRQAAKLAATDQEALEQRKNSWGTKILDILGATVQTTVGGFTGAIGSRAAGEAVKAIFNDKSEPRPCPR